MTLISNEPRNSRRSRMWRRACSHTRTAPSARQRRRGGQRRYGGQRRRGGRMPAGAPRPATVLLTTVLLIAVLLAGTWQHAQAAPIRRLGQNPRGLALGNTGISYANDEMALYYNPAGLGSIENFWVELLPISLQASDPALDLISDAGGSTFDSPATLIRDNIGKEIALGAFFYPHAVVNFRPGFSLGASYFLEVQTEILFRNQATPEAEAFFRKDTGTVFGLSFPTHEGGILWGISVRSINRTNGEGTISSADLALASAAGELDVEALLATGEGSGTGIDLGMIWRLESFSRLRGQFGLVIANVGDTDLGAAGEIPQEISFGWSFRPNFGPIFPVMFAIEFRDVTKNLTDDDSNGKRTHFGVEVGIFPQDSSTSMFTIRAGVNGDAATFGLEFSLWHGFTIQYVVYSQEYGDKQGEDTRERQLIQFNFIGF